jgi:N-acetylglutamate synthase-like GNAT family acetyltransferase
MLRPATRKDWVAIRTLLENAQLPTAGIGERTSFFVVFESQRRIVGTGGLEVHGRSGLIRSLAVVDSASLMRSTLAASS